MEGQSRKAEELTYAGALKKGTEYLAGAQVSEPEADAFELFSYVTGQDRTHYLMRCGSVMKEDELERYMELCERRAFGVPVQRITGQAGFMGMTFRVFPNVLIPRYDTEVLCEHALSYMKQHKGCRVLDMCTGTGCILISLALLGDPSFAAGCDISEEALECAEYNAKALGADVELVRGDLFENVTGTFDLIVSNPPYIRSGEIPHLAGEVRDFDPRLALDGGEDGLSFYRRIIRDARRFLSAEGMLALEIGYDQAEETSALMENSGYVNIRVYRDLSGLDRVVLGNYEG